MPWKVTRDHATESTCIRAPSRSEKAGKIGPNEGVGENNVCDAWILDSSEWSLFETRLFVGPSRSQPLAIKICTFCDNQMQPKILYVVGRNNGNSLAQTAELDRPPNSPNRRPAFCAHVKIFRTPAIELILICLDGQTRSSRLNAVLKIEGMCPADGSKGALHLRSEPGSNFLELMTIGNVQHMDLEE
jgi:hypothetical protein